MHSSDVATGKQQVLGVAPKKSKTCLIIQNEINRGDERSESSEFCRRSLKEKTAVGKSCSNVSYNGSGGSCGSGSNNKIVLETPTAGKKNKRVIYRHHLNHRHQSQKNIRNSQTSSTNAANTTNATATAAATPSHHLPSHDGGHRHLGHAPSNQIPATTKPSSSREERRKQRRATERYRAAHASRERLRVEAFNAAFAHLRLLLPTLPPDKKLSKIEVLRLAICYISYLGHVLEAD